MIDQKRFTKRTAAVLIMVGLFVFLLYLYFFVPFKEVVSTVQQANLVYYSLAFGALILSMAFYSLTWHGLLSILSVKSSFRKAFQFVLIGSFVDLLVPAESVSGDISRIFLMSKESGENAGKVTASVIGQRILSMAITFGGLVISSVYFILKYQPSLLVIEFIGIIVVSSVIVLSFLFYLSAKRQATERIVKWIINFIARFLRGRWRLGSLKSKAMKMLRAFHDGIATLGKRPKSLALPVLFTILAWFFDLLIAVLVFFSLGSLGERVSLSAIVIVYSIVVGIQYIPVGIPGEVGLIEIVMTSLYTLLGVPIALSAVATVLIRVMTLWVKLLIGGVAVQWLGIKGFRGAVTQN